MISAINSHRKYLKHTIIFTKELKNQKIEFSLATMHPLYINYGVLITKYMRNSIKHKLEKK